MRSTAATCKSGCRRLGALEKQGRGDIPHSRHRPLLRQKGRRAQGLRRPEPRRYGVQAGHTYALGVNSLDDAPIWTATGPRLDRQHSPGVLEHPSTFGGPRGAPVRGPPRL